MLGIQSEPTEIHEDIPTAVVRDQEDRVERKAENLENIASAVYGINIDTSPGLQGCVAALSPFVTTLINRVSTQDATIDAHFWTPEMKAAKSAFAINVIDVLEELSYTNPDIARILKEIVTFKETDIPEERATLFKYLTSRIIEEATQTEINPSMDPDVTKAQVIFAKDAPRQITLSTDFVTNTLVANLLDAQYLQKYKPALYKRVIQMGTRNPIATTQYIDEVKGELGKNLVDTSEVALLGLCKVVRLAHLFQNVPSIFGPQLRR